MSDPALRYEELWPATLPVLSSIYCRGGWHSRAVGVDTCFVFTFPQGEEAEQALRRGATILVAVRPHVSTRVSNLLLHTGVLLFSGHTIIPGEHLETARYECLREAAR